MNKKTIIIGTLIILIVLFAFLGFYYHDRIADYIEKETWLYAEPYENKSLELATMYEGGKTLYTVLDGTLKTYNNKLNQITEDNINSSKLLFSSKGAYTAIASQDKNFARVYKDGKLVWNKDFSFEIKSISISRKGITSIAFSQSGYKSVVKLYTAKGEEYLNIALASTYAIDTELSNDGKTLYIAEADFNGINASSLIKIVDVNTRSFSEINLDTDEIIVDIEYTESNGLVIQSDKALYFLSAESTFNKSYSFSNEDTAFVYIDSANNPFVVEHGDYALKVISPDFKQSIKLHEKPKAVSVFAGRIAVLLENEVWVLNENAEIIKKSKIEEGIINVVLFNNGKTLALVFNHKIELIGI